MYNNTGLIGHPLNHTLSPKIHNYFYSISNINGGYCCFDIPHDYIQEIINIFKKFNFRGFNVTLPYKTEILNYLDTISEEAKDIDAVNTVKIKDNTLIGYNTDLFGVEKTFETFSVDLNNKKILILGSGGSAKPLFYYLKNKNIKVDIVNRTPKNTEEILNKLKITKFNNFDLLFLKKNNYYDIIINTTSIGIDGGEFLNMDNIQCNEFAFDFQYSLATDTPFLSLYKNKVKNCTDGLTMLIYQGLKAFEIFNDAKLDLDINRLKKIIYRR